MHAEATRTSGPIAWVGIILSAIVMLFLAGDFIATLMGVPAIKNATLAIGFPLGLIWLVGGLQLACLVLYAIPATSVLGAILLTGFLGAAVFSHLRVTGVLTGEMIVSLGLGLTAWGALWCRDPRLRALVPVRR